MFHRTQDINKKLNLGIMKNNNKILIGLMTLFLVFGMSSCEEDDSIAPNVAVGSFDVTAAFPGDPISITGENFNTVQFLFVGKTQTPFQLEGNTLSFIVPEDAIIGNNTITLAMTNNYRVNANFEVLLRPVPVIRAITPSAGIEGEQITIYGISLDNLDTITVGEVEATVVSSTATELVFTVPSGLPNNLPTEIKIVTSGGETTSESIFYIGENFLSNGEFELGDGDDFTNWSKFNGGDGLTATTDSNEAYADRSLKVLGVGGDAWRTQMASDAATTQVDMEYTFTMWIKAEAGSPGDGGNIRFSTTPEAMYSANYDITSEWQQIQWVFNANIAETQIVLDMGVVENAVYFVDNATLIETGAAGPQLVEILLNGGYEEGSGDDFTNWNKFNGGDLMTATTVADEVHGGSRALKAIGVGADAWRTQMASDILVTEVGVDYAVSLWIKGEAGTPGDGGSVRMSTAGNSDAQYQASFAVTTDWQKIEWVLTANGTETQIVLDMGETEDAVYFVDDVSVKAPPE